MDVEERRSVQGGDLELHDGHTPDLLGVLHVESVPGLHLLDHLLLSPLLVNISPLLPPGILLGIPSDLLRLNNGLDDLINLLRRGELRLLHVLPTDWTHLQFL